VPRNEDAGEVVGPGEVEIDGVADDAERHGEEGGQEDGPVLVGQQMLLHTRDQVVKLLTVNGRVSDLYPSPDLHWIQIFVGPWIRIRIFKSPRSWIRFRILIRIHSSFLLYLT